MHQRFTFFMLVTFFCFVQESCALTLTTEDYPPYNIVDPHTKNVGGISTEKVVELMRRANEKYTVTPYPWARAYQLALQENDTCVFSTTRTPDREPLFKWVGPLVTSDWVVFGRANDKRTPKSLEDIRSFVIGGYNNDAVATFLQQQGFKVNIAVNDTYNPRLLVQEFIDFWATGEFAGHYIISKGEYRTQIVPLFKFKKTEMYLACNARIDMQRIDHLNRILMEMERDGTTAGIERKYR